VTRAAGTAGRVREALARAVGDHIVAAGERGHLRDATETRGIAGRADAVALPSTTEEVAAVVRWCYANGLPVVPRGGGTGFAGGAVPVDGGVVVGLERMTRVRAFEPLRWRVQVEAGMPTAALRRRVRESGLVFPPDPGAAESSQIGGNVATNAGGPHAFKYGATGAWVTGLEAVVPPGDVIAVGGPVRKDVAGYDLVHLLVGSEGTLGIVTAAWLRLIPAPEAAFPVVGVYRDAPAGCRAIELAMASGIVPAAIEYLDAGTLARAGAAYPWALPAGAGFMVIAEADGSAAEAEAGRRELRAALAEDAVSVEAPARPEAIERLWQWRDGVSLAVTASCGGKVSEDVAVPVEALGEAIERTVAIGREHGVTGLSWGHAGDGNLHCSFLLDPGVPAELERARAAAHAVFDLALALGGTVTGEHGIGVVKNGQLRRQWPARAVDLHRAVKHAFDPQNLMNPGKKLP
jgi:glycolate dehydrogenase FAD-linked subunit